MDAETFANLVAELFSLLAEPDRQGVLASADRLGGEDWLKMVASVAKCLLGERSLQCFPLPRSSLRGSEGDQRRRKFQCAARSKESRHQAGPARLMRSANAATGVAMKIFVEQHVVSEMRVGRLLGMRF